ncbi:MAG: hypothetical protein ACKON8_01605, partial [Planctomycetota bacterium]
VDGAGGGLDRALVADRLAASGPGVATRWIGRAAVEEGGQLAVFADGRAIVTGTREEARARAIVARYLGA